MLKFQTSTSGECSNCFFRGSKHCWEYQWSGEGDWNKAQCCKPGECDEGYSFCTDDSDGDLKFFTCPQDEVCLSQQESVVKLSTLDQVVSKTWKFSRTEILSRYNFCKFQIFGDVPETSGRETNLKIKFKSLKNIASAKMIWLKNEDRFSDFQRYTYEAKEATYSFPKVTAGQQWFILVEPEFSSDGVIEFSTWAELKPLPKVEENKASDEQNQSQESEKES